MSAPTPELKDYGTPQSDSYVVDVLTDALSRGDSTSAVSTARTVLANFIRDERASLVKGVSSQATQIEGHVTRGEQLAADASQLHGSLSAVDQAFRTDDPKSLVTVSDFMTRVSERQASASAHLEAKAKIAALEVTRSRYRQLCEIEDAVWSGRAADDSALAALKDISRPRSDDSLSSVETALQNRIDHLHNLVSDQLALAWKDGIVIGDGTQRSAVTVKLAVHLQSPNAPRLTPSPSTLDTTPRAYTCTEIGQALSQLGALSDLLQQLQSRIIRSTIEPLVTKRDLAVQQGNGSTQVTLNIDLASDVRQIDVVANVRSVLVFVGDQILPPSTLDGRDAFMTSLVHDAFHLVLERVLLPAMPHSLKGVAEWLQLVRQSADWEQELLATSGEPGPLHRFLHDGAGEAWLDERRRSTVQQTRHMIHEEWQSWSSKTVNDIFSQRRVTDNSQDDLVTRIPQNEDEEGWGFSEPSDNKDEDDGWNFDDFEVKASQPIAPVKPVREAKRLGKRLAQKEPLPEQKEDASPILPPSPPPAQQSVPSQSTLPQNHDDSSFRVSIACDQVITMASTAVDNMKEVADKLSADSAFRTVPRGISQQLCEALDMVRATVPIVSSSHLRSRPAVAMQLSNDFQYIANGLAALESSEQWAERSDVVNRFSSASDVVYNTCIEEHIAENGAMIFNVDFADCSNEATFATASAVIEALVSRISEFGTTILPVVALQKRNEAVGRMIESLADVTLDRILGLEDITEVESERLGMLLSTVERLDQLFQSPGGLSTIASFVPHWLKLCYTNQLLRANLADIEFLFDAGSLVDFSSEELGRVVRALFSDSPKRAALLRKVEGDGPG